MKLFYTKMACSLALGFIAFICPHAHAEKAVVVVSDDGSTREIVLSDLDRIEIGASAVTFKTAGEADSNVSFADLDRILIGLEANKVKDLTAAGEIAIWPTTVIDVINFSGLTSGDEIAVFDMKGAKVARDCSLSDTLSLNLGNLPGGYYIVKVRNHSVKIVKK